MRRATVIKALLFAAGAVGAGAGLTVTASNTNTRTDLTLTGQHRIGERTRARLGALADPVELVVAVAGSSLDPRRADRVDDVLDALDAASDRFSVTRIDVTGPDGDTQFEALAGRLAARDRGARQNIENTAEQTGRDAQALRAELTALDRAATNAARASTPNARRLGEFAAFARAASKQLDQATTESQGDPSAGVRSTAALAAKLAPELGTLREELGEMETGPGARRLLNEAARAAATASARAASLAAISLPMTDSERVAEALGTGEAALLIGPARRDGQPGVVALDLDAFYPPPEVAALDRTGEADARVRAEQLVAQGLAVLTDSARPVVVFVHAEPQRFVGKAGVLPALIERLADAGIGHAEWPVSLDPDPPPAERLDPSGARPIVYAVISPNSAATSNPRVPESVPGTEKANRIANAAARLIGRGDPVLLGLNPSVFPTFGDEDPVASLLEPLGLRIDSAAPVLTTANTPLGPATTWELRLVPSAEQDEPNPIAAAVRGLPLTIDWPLPMTPIDPVPGGPETAAPPRVTPLLTLDAPAAWSETDWLAYWRTPRAQRSLLRDPPAFTPDSNDRRGPFTVAAAIEHGSAAPGRAARVVVIGSNTWFLDRAWQGRQTISGRSVLVNPGNPELFDACVLWLAGREELIAPSPQARPVARIGPVSDGTLTLLRWSLIGGMPLGILLIGGAWRLARG